MKRFLLIALTLSIMLLLVSCNLPLSVSEKETEHILEEIEGTQEKQQDEETELAIIDKQFAAENAKDFIGGRAFSYTVGEDRYDIDCDAYLLKTATLEDYKALVEKLEQTSLEKYTDNGNNGILGECYQTTLADESYTVNVTFYQRVGELYMTVEEFRALSPHQIAPTTTVKGTSTTFHMPEMPTVNDSYKFGECEIFELSNGHFVIVDGAQEYSAEPTVEYLEALTPDGEKPVVEAWFLTHAHPDHAYCVWGIGRNASLVDRISVEGFYYTWPNDEGMRKEHNYEDLLVQVANVNAAMENFRDTNGNQTPRYKLHSGMRFYFNELEIQVLFTQDQMMPSAYGNGFNDSSTSYKFIVHTEGAEDTTFLVMGDASEALCKKLIAKYSASTLHTDFFQSLHHGNNDSIGFFKYITPNYLCYTHKSDEKGKNREGYKYLASTCKQVFFSPVVIKIPFVDSAGGDSNS